MAKTNFHHFSYIRKVNILAIFGITSEFLSVVCIAGITQVNVKAAHDYHTAVIPFPVPVSHVYFWFPCSVRGRCLVEPH